MAYLIDEQRAGSFIITKIKLIHTHNDDTDTDTGAN